jgi:hypothetical protein
VVHTGCINGFDTDDFDVWAYVFDVGADAGNQAATTNRYEHGINRTAALFQDFDGNSALARNDLGIIVRMDEGHAGFFGQFTRICVGIVIGITMQIHLGGIAFNGVDFDLGGGFGHDDAGGNPQALCGHGHTLGMVAGRCGNDTLV